MLLPRGLPSILYLNAHPSIQNEHALLTELAILPAQLQATYCTYLTPLLSLVSSSLTQLTTRVKRALQQHAFLALAAYARLSSPNVQQQWDDIISRRSGKFGAGRDQTGVQGKKADLNVNALKEGLHSLRAVCLRSFPEFLADIKLAAIPKGGAVDVGTGVVEICETVGSEFELKCILNVNASVRLGREIYAIGAGSSGCGCKRIVDPRRRQLENG